ncbi:MAG: NlpC/P60 family protein [Candidatus Levyibacteriota bacterium]
MKNRLPLLILLSLPVIFILFLIVSFNSTAALAVTSNCIVTKIGTPPGDPQLPAACNSGGGNQAVIKLALQQLGKKYTYGGPQPRVWASWDPASHAPTEFDCSSLVGWAWYWGTGGKVNFPVTTTATWDHMSADKFIQHPASDFAQIQPGDAIYFTTPTYVHHTALYEGPGNCPSKTCMIEAQQDTVPVKESDFQSRITSKSDPAVGFIHPTNF